MSRNRTPEVRVEARVRNNVLWHAIFDRYGSVAEFCRAHPEVNQSDVGELLNLKGLSPHRPNGKYRKACLVLSSIFRMLPDDLFPARLYQLEQTEMVAEISFVALPSADKELLLLPDTTMDGAVDAELKRATMAALCGLGTREEKILRMRFGLDGNGEHSLAEIGDAFRVSTERIRQIEAKALRKLRHPSRTKKLRTFLD